VHWLGNLSWPKAWIPAALAPTLHAQTGTAPGTHTTIQEAIDDKTCVTITLSAGGLEPGALWPRPLRLRVFATLR